MGRVTGAVIRYRYPILTVWTAAFSAHIFWQRIHSASDYYVFAFGGRAILGWQPAHVVGGLHLYSEFPQLQVGPVPLVLAGLLSPLHEIGNTIWALLIIACGVATVRALERTMLNLGQPVAHAAVSSFVAGLVLLAAWGTYDGSFHLEDAYAVAAIVGSCAAIAGRRSVWVPALLIGSAAAGKPWAVIALPLLITYPWRTAIRGLVVACFVAVVTWLPFVIADPSMIHALSNFRTEVWASTAFAALHGTATGPGTGIRVASMLLGFGAGLIAIIRGRWLAAPMAAMAGRLMLEPRFYYYYEVGPLAAALLWDLSTGRKFPRWTLATVTVHFGLQYLAPARVAAFGELLLAVVIILAVSLPRRRQSQGVLENEENRAAVLSL